ncbi:YhdH/YhfP family quinone oxidoreductase [Ilyobacter polytropus]|uniref:Quinone oxidoreductase, YhdH/YhfP family n=1 Tax=Ilyobacter polytropus (strain ATCC 51220 / DSM 2926 / LMG 16218 / CuHBu1) TaxID=572544 RepID=E3HDS5_ILYPC|nr:YhdH/YhfP family quinone oxidoreductase [Ilyobacter polytropus]ADO84261.1 quinone oxidoreductase, YhdH/YhfP family [Ilyobacter polytropus DSM 2926]
MKFRAVRIFEEDGKFLKKIVERSIDDLPEGDVVINVKYTSLNYKDALSCIGNRGVTRNYPHTPGIDAAGVVTESKTSDFKPGDEVILTGFDLGMNTDGGFGEYIRVPKEWVIKRPENLSLKEAMVYGTAGFTAGLSVYELMKDVKPENGKILVSGGTGGVGSHAVRFLSKMGYNVTAVINGDQEEKLAKELGAKDTVNREVLDDKSGKALLKQSWAGVVDTVGGNPLSTAIRSASYGGVVTTCGNVAGGELPFSTVYPFILRGVKLVGIDSVQCPKEKREKIWELISKEWKGANLESGIKEVDMAGIFDEVENMLNGRLIGRVIIRHKG